MTTEEAKKSAVRDLFRLCVVCEKLLGDGPLVYVRNNTRAVHETCYEQDIEKQAA